MQNRQRGNTTATLQLPCQQQSQTIIKQHHSGVTEPTTVHSSVLMMSQPSLQWDHHDVTQLTEKGTEESQDHCSVSQRRSVKYWVAIDTPDTARELRSSCAPSHQIKEPSHMQGTSPACRLAKKKKKREGGTKYCLYYLMLLKLL